MARIADLLPRSLGGRILLLSGTLVAGAVALAVGFTAWRANALAGESVTRSLAGALATQVEAGRSRATQLRLIARVVAGDPSFVAYVAESDPASVRDLLFERQRELECDWAAVVDRAGRVVAHTGRSLATDVELSGSAAVAAALRGAESVAFVEAGGREHFCAAAPLVAGGTSLEGALVVGFALDEAYVAQMKRQSGADLAMIVRTPEERVIATTRSTGPALLAAVRARGGLDALAPPAAGRAPAYLTLDGRRWAAAAQPVFGPEDAAGLTALTLASFDDAVAPYRRIEQFTLLIGAIALLLAFALSFALSRRVTQPLAELERAVGAARRGRYDQPLPTASRGEVGRLARAFESLFGELREQREVEAYLASISRTMPEAVAELPLGHAVASPGHVVGGRFEILSFLGAGGMGVVYKARDRQLNDVVALKTLPAGETSAEALERLKNELRVARRVTHRHVLRTHDFGLVDGTPFISMEYVRGVTLRELLDHTGRLPFSITLRIARQLLAGMDAAHAMGVVHGDIKPENLILDATGQVHIMDFGIAHAVREQRSGDAWMGTFAYLSPEQLGGAVGDARSDLYACGVVLYEMLAERRPFPASAAMELAYRVMNEDPPSLREFAPDTPARLVDAVMQCLARDPAARPASAAVLLATVEEIRP